MAFETILYEKREPHIGWVTLNRPERLNAMNRQMHDELYECLRGCNEDEDVRVVVLTGAGRGFCAGADVSGGGQAQQASAEPPPRRSSEEGRQNMRYGQQKSVRMLRALDKPTIAMVNGVAVGHGFDMALACDLRIGSPNTRFQVAYIRRGLVPGSAGCYLMPQIMPLNKALEYIYTADFVEAEEALRHHILNKLVPAEELESTAMELATKIALNPPISLKLCKMMVYKGFEMNLDSALEMAALSVQIASASDDAAEGARAFVEKRQPVFKGR
ncbi:MAG: enoyl-CoA hydratase/isomerase family protein [Chloroflexi bacterium]|nr:enoyl-CoA hydratase/isomerase family protein [Chloroflexota bacterium]